MKSRTFTKSKFWILCAFLLSFTLPFQACEDDNVEYRKKDWVAILPLSLEFPFEGDTQSVDLVFTPDVDIDAVTFKVDDNGKEWCTVTKDGNKLTVTTSYTFKPVSRSTVVTLTYKDLTRELPVTQHGVKADNFKLIKIEGMNADSENSAPGTTDHRPKEHSYDGDYTTYFHSKIGTPVVFPFKLDYTLETPNKLERIVYYPRINTGLNVWGEFRQFKVFVTTKEKPDTRILVATINRSGILPADATFLPIVMNMEEPIVNAEKVYFEVSASINSRVSCAEMEFYAKDEEGPIGNNDIDIDPNLIFSDILCTQLKPEITAEDITDIPNQTFKMLADLLYRKKYDTDYRVAEFRPYQNPRVMANQNRIYHAYSIKDNPTGIYVEAGSDFYVCLEDDKGQNISICIQNLDVDYAEQLEPVKKGMNKISVNKSGLVYVYNHVQDYIPVVPETAEHNAVIADKTVKMHFILGTVNGYFDVTKNTAAEWTEILKKSRAKEIDVLSEHSHLAWSVDDFITANTDIFKTMKNLDDLVNLQNDLMGIFKYHKEDKPENRRKFNNRAYFHVINTSVAYATMFRTAYLRSNYGELFVYPERFVGRIWGPGHELGHINQTVGFKWAGMTEVTNNLMAMHARFEFGGGDRLLDLSGGQTVYQQAKENILDTGAAYPMMNTSASQMWKLVPIWQIKLYMVNVLGKDDFYRDLYEYYRTRTGTFTSGEEQLDFVRQVCRLSGLNMLDFFEKWGFTKPVDQTFNDYGMKTITITQEQIDALKEEIEAKGYDMPAHDNIEEITGANYETYM